MLWVVYTRARARARLTRFIYIDPNNNNNNPYILTPTHYTYWGFERVSLVRTRDTPQHAKSQKIVWPFDPEITVIFVTFAPPLAAHLQFLYRIYNP